MQQQPQLNSSSHRFQLSCVPSSMTKQFRKWAKPNSPNKGKLFITIYSGIVNTLPLAITGQFLLTNQYKQILVLESNQTFGSPLLT